MAGEPGEAPPISMSGAKLVEMPGLRSATGERRGLILSRGLYMTAYVTASTRSQPGLQSVRSPS